jgi:hypothetical protein
MAEKPKKKTAKPKRDAPGVMGSLPAQRPARIATGRSAAARTPAPKTTPTTAAASAAAASATPPAKAPAKPKPAPAKPGRAAKPKSAAKKAAATAAKPKATRAGTAAATREAAAKPRVTAARRKAAAPRTFEPTQAAEAAAGAADERAAGIPIGASAPPASDHTYPRPQAVRESAPGIGRTTLRDQPASGSGRPSGTELIEGAVKAAGQVAQIGLAIGGQLVKKAVSRLPRP